MFPGVSHCGRLLSGVKHFLLSVYNLDYFYFVGFIIDTIVSTTGVGVFLDNIFICRVLHRVSVFIGINIFCEKNLGK